MSLAGTWMQTAAQQWLVYRLTGSPLSLGTVTFAATLPPLLFMPFTGTFVDRVDKRKLIVGTQAAMMLLAFGLAALTFSGRVQFWHVVIFAALLGTANSFDMPARQAFTVELVGKSDLLNAVALNASAFNIARLAGPAVSGILVGAIGEGWSFTINGASFLAVLAGLMLMTMPPRPPRAATRSPMLDVQEGWGYLLRNRTIRLLVLSVAAPSLLGFNYVTLIPVFAGDILHIGPEGFGVMLSAIGGGALLAALLLATTGGRLRRGWLVTAGALTFSCAQIGFGLSRQLGLSLVFLFLLGLATVSQLASTNTLIQTHVDDRLRGRVMGIYLWVLIGMSPPGALIMGAVAEAWGAPAAVIGAAVLGLLFALGIIWRAPEVRRLK